MLCRTGGQARRVEFYRWWGVPDTLEGRFELLALHVFLVVHHLKRQGEAARRFSRRLFEVMVADVDRAMSGRCPGESGGLSVRALARAFNLSMHAYDRSLDSGCDEDGPDRREPDHGGEVLVAARVENLYRTESVSANVVVGMAGYVCTAAELLMTQPLEQVIAGRIYFPEPPMPAWAGFALGLLPGRVFYQAKSLYQKGVCHEGGDAGVFAGGARGGCGRWRGGSRD